MSDYTSLLTRQLKEISDFPIAYAFNDEQLKEALNKLGANDISECCTVCGFGDILKKENAKPFKDMLKRHSSEIKELIKNPDKAYEAFLYEMDNHEYAINWDGDSDVLSCFSITENDLEEMGLKNVYVLARKEHMRKAHEEWDMI